MTHRRAGFVEHSADGTERPVTFTGRRAREAGLRVLEIRRRASLPRAPATAICAGKSIPLRGAFGQNAGYAFVA